LLRAETKISYRWYHSRNLANIVPAITEAYAKVLGTQARFSTSQQSFLSLSDLKKRACCISKNVSFS